MSEGGLDLTDPREIKREMRRRGFTMNDLATLWGLKRRESASRRLSSGRSSIHQLRQLMKQLGYTKITAS